MIFVHLPTWRTDLSLSVRTAPSAGLERALDRLLRDEVARLERLASRFRADSELSAVNARAGEWVEVSWSFVAVLTASLTAAKRTGGIVDPTLGRAVIAAGYDQWAGQTTPGSPRVHTGRWSEIGIRPGRREAQVLTPSGTALDLGSIAKAYLADRLARTVADSGYEVCANMGGDLRVIAEQPWTVIADPETPGVAEVPVDLTNAAMATSGVGRRRWAGGHHLIDPRTGRPADTAWHNVCVVAANAVDANAASTAGVILGADGPAWMAAQGLDARFTGTHGIETIGRWTPAEETAA